MIKKTVSILLVFMLILGLAACGESGPKPEDTIRAFCDGMKDFDFAAMQSCVADGQFDMDDVMNDDEEDLSGLVDYLKSAASELTYTVKSSEVSEDTAKVAVDFDFKDVSPVIKEAFVEYIAKAFEMMFSGATEDEVADVFSGLLQDKMESVETTRAQSSVSFDLKLADGAWKISEVPEEIANVITGNMVKGFEDIGSMFGEDEGWDSSVEPVEYPISNEVLVDEAQAKITLLKAGSDEWGDSNFSFLLENNTDDKTLSFRIELTSVNGWTVFGGSVYEDITAGKKANSDMVIWGSTLKDIGIETPDEVTLRVRVSDADLWMEEDEGILYEGDIVIYPTDAPEVFTPGVPDGNRNETIVDSDLYTFTIVNAETDEYGNYMLQLYMNNKSDTPLYFGWSDVAVNGFMIEPFFGCTVYPGTQCLNSATFYESDLQDNGIEEIEEIEYTLEVSDDDTWDTLESEVHIFRP